MAEYTVKAISPGPIGNGAQTGKTVAEIVTAAGTLVAAFWAAWTYHRSANLERAKWMRELYDRFYERGHLRVIRDVLDGDDTTRIATLVEAESSDFTDYLNFFEFLAYLVKSKQIRKKELVTLFEYYLGNLNRNKGVAEYTADPTKGYEQLQWLLGTIERRN